MHEMTLSIFEAILTMASAMVSAKALVSCEPPAVGWGNIDVAVPFKVLLKALEPSFTSSIQLLHWQIDNVAPRESSSEPFGVPAELGC